VDENEEWSDERDKNEAFEAMTWGIGCRDAGFNWLSKEECVVSYHILIVSI